MDEPITINELKDPFFSLKIKKSAGNHEVIFNVIKNCVGKFWNQLKYL